jgi:hypothetical protein
MHVLSDFQEPSESFEARGGLAVIEKRAINVRHKNALVVHDLASHAALSSSIVHMKTIDDPLRAVYLGNG